MVPSGRSVCGCTLLQYRRRHAPRTGGLKCPCGINYIRYQEAQFRGLVDFLERQTGKKLDDDRLWETIRLGDEAWRLWYEVDRLRVAHPCPMPTQDHFSIMVAGHYYCGTQVAVDFYQTLYNEVKEKVANGQGVIPEEKYRLLYGGDYHPGTHYGSSIISRALVPYL